MSIDALVQSAFILEQQGRLSEAKKSFSDAVSLLNQQALLATNQAERARLISRADDVVEYIRVMGNVEFSGPYEQPSDSSVSADSTESCAITFADVKGLEEVKRVLRRQFVYRLKFPHVYSRFGLKHGGGGVILFGSHGVGKTMIAKALAGELGAVLYEASCSTWLDMYLGEAEKNISSFFVKAIREATIHPVLVFLDEVDAVAMSRKDRDSEAMNRVVSQLLLEMAAAVDAGVMIVAATNRFDALDRAFLRYGRFRKWIHIPLPDAPTRAMIADAELKKAPCQEDGFAELIADMTEKQNGADVKGLVEESLELAAERQVELELRGVIEPQLVTMDDILKAADEHCHSS